METRPPTITRILIAVGFAISCFALALFLWLAFGGPIPLKPEGYRFTVPFDEATQLATESDVRISGVSVGKVKGIELDDEGSAEATIELEARYAPIPVGHAGRSCARRRCWARPTSSSARARRSPSRSPRTVTLASAQVSDAVQLDEIFRAFDPRTRAAFQAWMQGQAAAFRGRGDDFSVTIASLEPFADQLERSLRVLDSQSAAVTQFVSDGGEVFEALSERQGQLRGLIENANTVFATTAERNEDLADRVHDLPDLPARVADDAEPARAVRDRHRSGGHGPAPDGARADAHRAGARAPLARAGGLLRRASIARSPPPPTGSRRRDSCSTTSCRRCWLASTHGSRR